MAVSYRASQARLRFERSLAQMRLSFLPHRAAAIELAAFPSMVGLYWQLAQPDHAPEQRAFVDAVVAAYGTDNEAVRARASRAYPSLVRQQHFELVLRERFPIVLHSEELDHQGIDIVVIERGVAVGVALAVETDSARDWQRVKFRRHPRREALPVLELWADRERALHVGLFWLHRPEQADEVAAFLDQTRQLLAKGWA